MRDIESLSKIIGFKPEVLKQLAVDFPQLVEKRRKKKKNGRGYRSYLAPDKNLLKVQQAIKKKVLETYELPACVRGLGGTDNSHVANALEHSANHELIHLDIVDFYDSIPASHVFIVFKKIFRFNEEAAKLLTALTSFQGRLWQGLATSSHLAIICSASFTGNLETYAKKSSLNFSQYGDDLFFSAGSIDATEIAAFVIGQAKRHGLNVKRSKIEVDKSGTRKVTGSLSGNSLIRAPKNVRKKTELLARLYSKYGNQEVEGKLKGSLLFLRQCRPDDAEAIIKKYNLKI